jgi:hypothetical protein
VSRALQCFYSKELAEFGESGEISPRKFLSLLRLSAGPRRTDIWGGKNIWNLSIRCLIYLVYSTLGYMSRSEMQARNASYTTVDIENLSGRCQRTLKNHFLDGCRQIACYRLAWKSHDATWISHKLSMRSCRILSAPSTITDWLKKVDRGDDITRCASGNGKLPDDRIDAPITSSLEQCQFHSLGTLCSVIKRPRTTIWRHLGSAGFVPGSLHLLPHELSPSQKAGRVGMVIELQ